ncbi:MAG TPA: hypothetical protein DEA44_07470 [Firmicutes bacterium]|nr:hypothetical protein [Bacillota bacterium]
MPKITAELLEKLEAWRRAGDRSITLEQRGADTGWMIFIHDLSVMNGAILKEEDLGKDWDALLLVGRRASLQRELEALDKKMGV